MKKIVSFLIVLTLLLCMIPAASAAGTAYWSGPDTVRPGDTITLTFYAGGGILGGSGSVSFDPSVLTLKSYTQTIGGSWAVEFSGNTFVFYDNAMTSPITGTSSIFKAVFTVNANAPVGEALTVSATGVTVSDGQVDTGLGSVSYRATIAPPLSTNCDLSALSLSGASISPAFSAGVTSYSASVPFATSSVQVNATAADAKAKVAVSSPQLTAGGTTSVTVTVTAESGATKTYTIQVSREQDPNYVPSNNNKLDSLSVEGQTLSPVFSPDVTQYYIWLPYETETVSISGKPQDGKASVSVGEIPALEPGKGTDIPVTVTAEDKSQLVYTVTVVRAPAHENVSAYLECDHMQETEPVPEPTEPMVEEFPEPETTFPAVAVIVGAICLLAGIGLGIGGTILIGQKKAAPAEEISAEDEAVEETEEAEDTEETEETEDEEVPNEENDPV